MSKKKSARSRNLEYLSAEAHVWALETADTLLAPLEADLFGRDEKVRAWIERATCQEVPVWRERIHLGLLTWQVERSEPAWAREHPRQIETAGVLDQAHEALARAFAESAPAEAGEELAAIAEAARRASTVTDVAMVPEFTGSLENVYRLLMALEQDPEALACLLATLGEQHQDSLLVSETARQMASTRGAGLAEAAEVVLGHEAVTDAVKRKALRRFTEAFLADENALADTFARGIVATLRSEGLLDPEDEPEVLDGLGLVDEN